MPLEVSVRQHFQREFGAEPVVCASAPGRLELIGNHTDYNEGWAVSAAIDRHVWVAAGPGPGRRIEVASPRYGHVAADTDPAAPAPEPRWARYVVGVFRSLQQAGYRLPAARLAIDGNVPEGAGLGSSAALTTATAQALCALGGIDADPVTAARICQQAEQAHVGTACGLLDPLTSLCSRPDQVLLFDFRSLVRTAVPWLGSEVYLAVTLSGVTRPLADSAYNRRRRQCARALQQLKLRHPGAGALRDVTPAQLQAARADLDRVALRRARHVITENERARRAAVLLSRGDARGCGKLLRSSHESSRLDFENSCRELDALVDIAGSLPGTYGARLTGGGFGGATVSMVEQRHADDFVRALKRSYRQRTGRWAEVLLTLPAAGARIVHPDETSA